LNQAAPYWQGTDHHDKPMRHIDDTSETSKHWHADGELNSAGLLILVPAHVATIGLMTPRMDVKTIASSLTL
jgi:hypothetical protein